MQKTGTKPIPMAAFERHFTLPELSKLWSIDPGAVRHMFKDEPAVVRVQTAPAEGGQTVLYHLQHPRIESICATPAL
jgi:hypothetical protein